MWRVAYIFTAMFGLSIMLIANRAFFLPGVAITDAQAVPKMARCWGRFSVRLASTPTRSGSGRRCSAALFGVWQSVPYLYADLYGIWKGSRPKRASR